MENDCFFKTRQEINNFFQDQIFEFHYSCDSVIEFVSITPTKLGGEYFNFRLCFFLDDKVFYKFSRLQGDDGWLDEFQIFEVWKLPLDTRETAELLYHKPFDNTHEQN